MFGLCSLSARDNAEIFIVALRCAWACGARKRFFSCLPGTCPSARKLASGPCRATIGRPAARDRIGVRAGGMEPHPQAKAKARVPPFLGRELIGKLVIKDAEWDVSGASLLVSIGLRCAGLSHSFRPVLFRSSLKERIMKQIAASLLTLILSMPMWSLNGLPPTTNAGEQPVTLHHKLVMTEALQLASATCIACRDSCWHAFETCGKNVCTGAGGSDAGQGCRNVQPDKNQQYADGLKACAASRDSCLNTCQAGACK